jgi:hypothetical protein
MQRIIGITGLNATGGVLATGKDTFADYLIACNPSSFIKCSFADPMRAIGEIFGFTHAQMTDRQLKEKCDEFWGISPRRFLQLVGTDMFRVVWRDDVWIKCMQRRAAMNADKHLIIPDLRFPNELKFIYDNNGIVIRLLRNIDPYVDSFQHPTEFVLNKLIDSGEFKSIYTIENNGTLADLQQAAVDFYNKFITETN